MGKDNVPFHTVGFPCTLFGVNEQFSGGKWIAAESRPWKFVDRLKGFNWLNYYGGKFSTSSKRGVFMDQALDIAPSDVWRGTALLWTVRFGDAVVWSVAGMFLIVGLLTIARTLLLLLLASRHARQRRKPGWSWGPTVTEPVSVIVQA